MSIMTYRKKVRVRVHRLDFYVNIRVSFIFTVCISVKLCFSLSRDNTDYSEDFQCVMQL